LNDICKLYRPIFIFFGELSLTYSTGVDVCHQVEQLTAERDNVNIIGNKAEMERAVLERQNAELRTKLAELEAETRTRFKTAMSSLEGRITNLEEQLDTEIKYSFQAFI